MLKPRPASAVFTIPKEEIAKMTSFGLSGEWEGIHYTAEMANIKIASTTINNFDGGYITLGYKYKNFLAYSAHTQRTDLSGDFYIVNTDPLAATKLTETNSTSFGLNFYGFDNVVIKSALAKYNEKYNQLISGTARDSNQFDIYSLTFDFIF